MMTRVMEPQCGIIVAKNGLSGNAQGVDLLVAKQQIPMVKELIQELLRVFGR